jgi:hypothetical protein
LEVFFIYLKLKLIVSPGIARGLFVDDKKAGFRFSETRYFYAL